MADLADPSQPNVSVNLRGPDGQPTPAAVAMTHTGNIRADKDGNVEYEVHPPAAPSTPLWVPQSHVTPLPQQPPKPATGNEGVQAEADFLMPQYVQDAIGRPPDLSSNGHSDLYNAVNLLNPLRGMSMPNVTSTAGPVNGPAEQDPAYLARLQAMAQNNLVRTPQGVYGYPLGTVSTTAPVSQ